MIPKSNYYHADGMGDEFLQGQINELKQYWGCQPARTLNDDFHGTMENPF